MGRAVLLALAVLSLAAPLRAQERPPQKPPRERMIEKLRTLDSASRPVSATKPDSLAADTLAEHAAATAPSQRTPAAAAAAPVAPVAPDSVVQTLRALEGYVVTEYRAARGHFAADSGRLELSGEPSLLRQGQSMKADSLLSYDEKTSIMCGYGKPLLEGVGGEPVQSDQVCFNIDRELGIAMGARTRFSEGGTWFVHGDTLITAGRDRVYGRGTDYTSCDLEVPHYHFAAKNVKIIHKDLMIARDVTLNFADVPVMWLPFMVQSMKQGRRSGLLTPSFGLTDVVRNSSGYRRQINNVGFYWAINDYMGAQVALGWRSDDYTAVDGDLQYRWDRQFLNGSFRFRRYWPVAGGSQFTLSTGNSWRPGERTSVMVGANYASSSSLLRRYSFDPEELNRSIDSNVGLNHRFDWGTFNLSAQRRQHLTQERVEMTLPSVSLSLSPVTLFRATGSEARWFNNATWTGSASFTSRRSDVNELLPDSTKRDLGSLDGSLNSSLNLGKFSWSQRFQFKEEVFHGKPELIRDLPGDTLPPDTLPAHPRTVRQNMSWSTSLGFSQRLVGTSSFSQSLGLSGDLLKSAATGGDLLAGPTRINFGASLNTNIYGFWPGVGPFGAFRHRIDPSFSYSYSPKPQVSELQRQVFGNYHVGETNQLRLGISQTIEAKYASQGDEAAAGAAADTAGPVGLDSGPRRLPQARKVTLLSLQTSALVYDFVRAREGEYGLTTTQLTHNLSSDLLKGLSVGLGHDLFRTDGGGGGRSFSPRVRTINANFSLDSDSWLFRALGLGAAAGAGRDSARREPAPGDSLGLDDPGEEMPERGLMRSGTEGQVTRRSQPVGTWRADLNYSLSRPPAGSPDGTSDQMLRGSVSFQPTEYWSVNWSTAYSFTDREFGQHYLSLTRDLHDWQATFSFVKTQTGNVSFMFRVHLLANPDIKFDYNQRGGAYDRTDPGF